MTIKALLLLVAVSSVVGYSIACTCFPAHPQVKLCQADFGIRVLVRNETLVWQFGENITTDPNLNTALYRYGVRVLYVYKGREFIHGTEIYVYSRGNSGVCGTRIPIHPTLPRRNIWVFTGYVNPDSGRLMIGSCDWLQRYYTLSYHQRISLNRGRYVRGCRRCMGTNGFLRCRIPNSHLDRLKCYHRYATCRPIGSTCRWLRGGGFRRCMRLN